ncbi:MAG: DNA/RNA nuclease SfsA [Bacillota bacterium]|nr:DNA/RNA nuclease SfsA [Bacillota bacterium]
MRGEPAGTPPLPVLPEPLVPVRFLRRRNRFAVEVEPEPGASPLLLHLANSGRMTELLVAGAEGMAHLRPRAGAGPGRRTAGSLVLIRHGDRWVGVDAALPNRLFRAALEAGLLEPFAGWRLLRAEPPLGAGRADFLLAGPRGETATVETKSCNRVEEATGAALFPDAPTARGRRHLEDLAGVARQGGRAAVVWFVQRDDARLLRPFAEVDPGFARAVARAAAAGVELLAYRCRLEPAGVTVLGPVPVEVEEAPGAPREEAAGEVPTGAPPLTGAPGPGPVRASPGE